MEEQIQRSKKNKRLIGAGIAIAVVLIAGIMYWQSNAAYETTDNAQLDGDILPVRAELTGKVSRIYFADNQQVRKGDTLLVFDNSELLAKIDQAAAALENAKANVGISGNKAIASTDNAAASYQNALSDNQAIIAAKANLNKARQDVARMNELVQYKAATQEQVDNAQTRLAVATADHDKAMNQQQSAMSTSSSLKVQAQAEQGQVSATQALVKQRTAELAQIQQQLEHAYIIAPFDGIVTKRAVQQGQYVTAGASLCTVIDQEHLWVTANFKETQLEKIRIGESVEVKLDAYPDLDLKGTVASFGGATGAKFSLIPPDNASGNFIKITQRFPIRIVLSSVPKNKPTVLFAGLSAFVKVKTR